MEGEERNKEENASHECCWNLDLKDVIDGLKYILFGAMYGIALFAFFVLGASIAKYVMPKVLNT